MLRRGQQDWGRLAAPLATAASFLPPSRGRHSVASCACLLCPPREPRGWRGAAVARWRSLNRGESRQISSRAASGAQSLLRAPSP
jgi:hypothetical protein